MAVVAKQVDAGLCCPDMGWTEPAYSRNKVDEAGRTLIAPLASREDRELALTVISNWRSSHSFPLNTLQNNLRKIANQRDADPTIAQRIKRLPSIRQKLELIEGMKLSRMQDIGGCRAVLSSVETVDEIAEYFKNESRMRHRLVREDPYIQCPKPSGYRGTHLVYAYRSESKPIYNGLRIEIQLRSRLQHAWATAVETVGAFTQQALKASSGHAGWLRFFVLMSSALAYRERTPLAPGTPTDIREHFDELRALAKKLDVVDRLNAYGETLRYVEQKMPTLRGHTFLLELDMNERVLNVRSYANRALAADEYSALERAVADDPQKDVVLVSVESLQTLQRAYPNYFLDTTAFVESVNEALWGKPLE